MRRHPLDLLSLLSGLVFLAVAVVYFTGDVMDRTPMFLVVMPLMIMGLGVAGLVAAVAAQRRNDQLSAARPDELPGGFPE